MNKRMMGMLVMALAAGHFFVMQNDMTNGRARFGHDLFGQILWANHKDDPARYWIVVALNSLIGLIIGGLGVAIMLLPGGSA